MVIILSITTRKQHRYSTSISNNLRYVAITDQLSARGREFSYNKRISYDIFVLYYVIVVAIFIARVMTIDISTVITLIIKMIRFQRLDDIRFQSKY